MFSCRSNKLTNEKKCFFILAFSALEENSFARFTIDKRLPQIFEDHCDEDYSEYISKTSVAKRLINCDAHLIEKLLPQLELYKNESIKSFFYTAPFLLVEFYFYHMLLSLNNYNENHFDFFAQKKHESVCTHHKKFLAILENLFDTKFMKPKEMLHSVLQYALFSNTEDLSQLNREENIGVQLLCDDTLHVYNFLQEKETAYKRFDIICDNAGAELFSDLYMACYFILAGYAE